MARLRIGADGTERATLAPGERSSSGYHAFNRDGDAYLVPSEAQPLIGRGELDLQLFNVSDLVEQGYADSESRTLPLIITYDGVRSRVGALRSTTPPKGATREHVLHSVGGAAVVEAKSAADEFWYDITTRPGRTGATGLRMRRNIDKIWLDASVHSTLDESAAQVGAPAAWARGLTGEGVTIATLDTGIDLSHPDFQGRIVAQSDFTGGTSVEDRAGHGTHVASIAGGSGAASNSRYRGVAPGSSLMIGKVLGDDGSGRMSDVIEGMEWAAGSGADVVNMSLGGPVTRGDDPMSLAVDRLTAAEDVLFVVAAGNYSPWVPGMEFVTSPASADSALAVGALRRPNSLWAGSRRGRMDGGAIKPEITAPGFAITAAGAAGAGLPLYTTKTGTSMAAPHVAGAAALLKQQHPGWGAEELRAALTSTAAAIDPFYTTYQRGAGRLDVDRASGQQVFVDAGVLHLGYFARPFDEDDLVVQRRLTYRNESDSPVTLDLSSMLTSDHGDGDPVSGALSVQPSTLRLAPGGRGQVTVTLDATDVPADTYSGRITGTAGKTEVYTTVGFYKQDDTVDVTLRAIGRDGLPGTATIRITPYKQLDGRYYPDYVYLSPQQPEYTLRLPEGDYNVWSLVTTFDESGRFAQQESIVADPKLEVRAPNFEVTLDARDAVPVSLQTPRPSQPRTMTMSWWRGDPGTVLYEEDTWYWSFNDGEPEQVYVTPTEQVDDAPFGLVTSFDAGLPVLEGRARGTRLDLVQVAGRLVDGRPRLPLVDVGTAAPEEIARRDLHGKVALAQETEERSPSEQVEALAAAGAEIAVLYSAQPGVFWPSRVAGPIPVLTLPMGQGEDLVAGLRRHPMRLHLIGRPRTPYAYDVTFAERGQVPDDLSYRARPKDLATITTQIFTTGTHERGWRLHQSAFTDCDCGAPAVDDFVPETGYTRTEYVTARPDLRTISAWQYLFGFPADILYSRAERTYEAGETVRQEWLKAPLSPGVAQSDIRAGGASPVSQRNGNRIYYSLATLTDSAGHWTPNFSPATAASRLYRDGEQIYANSRSLRGSVTVPSEEATYRLEADVSHDGSRIGLSTRTSTTWTFQSAAANSSEVLPLIDVDYTDVVDAESGQSALDRTNTAQAGRRVRLEMHATHQHGSDAPAVEEMEVDVSFDDGRSWQPALMTAVGESFTAEYQQPDSAAGGYVSLRVETRDGAGGTLEQTLIRAYHLEAK